VELRPASALVSFSTGKEKSAVGLPSVGVKRRVVIIDDEAAFAETLTKMVKSLGFDVTVSTDARSSYTFELKTSDIVFVDVLMPNLSGLQVLEKLAAQKAKSSIVLMSGHFERLDEAEKLARKLDLNLIGALEKPFRIEDVRDVLLGA
jgi:DNA-binding NtrC family response regulator